MKNNTNIKIAKKHQHKIDEIFREYEGYWVYLEEGYVFESMECGSQCFETQKELLEGLKDIVEIEVEEVQEVEPVQEVQEVQEAQEVQEVQEVEQIKNNTNIKIAKKYQGFIDEILKEYEGYWVYLKEGYVFQSMECGSKWFETQQELLAGLKDIVEA